MDHIENLVDEMTERLLAKVAGHASGSGGGSRSSGGRTSAPRTVSTRTGSGGRAEYA